MSGRLGNVPQLTGAARYAAPRTEDAEASRRRDVTTSERDVDRVTLRLSAAARAKVQQLYQLLRRVRRPIPTKAGIRMTRPSETAIVEQLILAFDIDKADELFQTAELASEKQS